MVDGSTVESGSSRSTVARPVARGWALVLAVALVLAAVSLIPKITSGAQNSDEAEVFVTVQYTIRKLANSGTAWAGLGIVAGWLVRRRIHAAAAGVLAGLVALVAHYAVGQSFGIFDSSIWATKANWFIAAVVFGGPLGLVGAFSRRADGWGLAARLLIPVGAVLEPFVKKMFINSSTMALPHQASNVVAGAILLVGGLLLGAAIVAADRRKS